MKVWNYVIITTGLMFILYIIGFNIPAVNNILSTLHLTASNQDIGSNDIYNYLFSAGGILLISIASIVVGFITNGKPENFIILPFISLHLVLWISALTDIMKFASSNYSGIISLTIIAILGPLTVGYLISLLEFFRGTD
jgi:hypothetical protein